MTTETKTLELKTLKAKPKKAEATLSVEEIEAQEVAEKLAHKKAKAPTTERFDEAVKMCVDGYKGWVGDRTDPEKGDALRNAVQVLRKVLVRMEVEVTASESDMRARNPLPVPHAYVDPKLKTDKIEIPAEILEAKKRRKKRLAAMAEQGEVEERDEDHRQPNFDDDDDGLPEFITAGGVDVSEMAENDPAQPKSNDGRKLTNRREDRSRSRRSSRGGSSSRGGKGGSSSRGGRSSGGRSGSSNKPRSSGSKLASDKKPSSDKKPAAKTAPKSDKPSE